MKIKVKKYGIAAITMVCLALLLTGCGNKEKERPSLYDKGLICVATLSGELNEEYVGYFSSSPELTEIVKNLADQDYSQPESVYELKYSEGGLKQFLISVIGLSTSNVPDAVVDRATGFSYLANIINARQGSNYIALSSILTTEELFVNEAVTENTAYLYFYNDAYPVMVSFRVGEDGAICATGTYIFSDELKEQGADCITKIETDFGMLLQLFEITKIK